MADRTYCLADRRFTMPPLVARQEKQLWPILKPLFAKGDGIEAQDIVTLLAESIVRICAIVLVPEGITQAEKARGGDEAIQQLEDWLEMTVSVGALGPVVADFFDSGQQWTMLAGLAAPLRLHRPTTGSTIPSAPLPTATSSEPTGSGITSVLASASGISNGTGSGGPLNAPSLPSAA
jgi:hypothetical protein